MRDKLLETDQIRCYARNGQPIGCSGTGQDASVKKTRRRTHAQRFSIKAHVVEDRLTGAIWTRDANPGGFPQTWHEALAAVAKMRDWRDHGYGDWQIPSRDLLFSLIGHQHINPAMGRPHPFENIFNGYYWTRDSCCRLPDQAWYVHLGGGRVHRGMKHGSYLLWPVCPGSNGQNLFGRSGGDRFLVDGDGDGVHDRETGLTWSRSANPIGHPLSWQDALSAANAFVGKKSEKDRAWRLPNIRELESLVALDAHTPALPAGHPFIDIQDAYWSSTTSVYEPRYAWTLYTRDGQVGVGFKPHAEFFLWPVRGR
jgi:hypothetical protein